MIHPIGSEPRRFTLDRSRRRLLGVCGGIANYFDIDVLWVRIGFIAATLALGFPLLLYPAFALVAD